jgi:chromosome partitioning protein
MTAKIITVFNQKGGCGKTMTTMQLSGFYGSRGLKVFVIDMDLQGTSSLWALQAESEVPFPASVLSMAALSDSFVNKLAPIVEKHDVVLIDCPPAIESRVPWASLLISDLGLIPVVPVMDNIWASKKAEELILEAQAKHRADLKGAYVLNMVRRGNIFDTCLEQLNNNKLIPILNTHMGMRNVFPESQLFGTFAEGFGTSAGAKEIEKVGLEVAALIGLNVPKKTKGAK